MRKFALLAGAGVGLMMVSCGKKEGSATPAAAAQEAGHVLASKDDMPGAGFKATREAVMDMAGGTLKLKAAGREIDGSMSQNQSEVETLEGLGGNKIRLTLVSKSVTGKMVINGQEQAMPSKPELLKGLPVILTLDGDQWSASLESGTATAGQQKELDKLTARFGKSEDLVMYGETPRKPGDKWQVDPGGLSSFGDAGDLKGTFEVEFTGVTEYAGVRCAVLKARFDLAGKLASEEGGNPPAMTLKGEADIHRSLEDLTDLDVAISGNAVIEGTPAPNVSMRAEGPMKMSTKVTIQRPGK